MLHLSMTCADFEISPGFPHKTDSNVLTCRSKFERTLAASRWSMQRAQFGFWHHLQSVRSDCIKSGGVD
jgi:hypothetical protein